MGVLGWRWSASEGREDSKVDEDEAKGIAGCGCSASEAMVMGSANSDGSEV